MRHRISLTSLFLALACSLALPLSAADTLDLDAPALVDLAPAPVYLGEACLIEDSLDGPAAFADAFEGERLAVRTCRENACDRYCKAVFGPFAGGFCEDGTCQCAV